MKSAQSAFRRSARSLEIGRAVVWSSLVLALGIAPMARAQSGVIDFEASVADGDHQNSWGGADEASELVPYVEDGFSVRAIAPSSHLLANNPAEDTIGNGPDGGSKHMATIGVPSPYPPVGEIAAGMRIGRSDGVLFRVVDLRLSEYSAVFDYPLDIRIRGFRSDGIVEQTFTLDGVNDGTGPLADFELVALSPAFAGLIGLEIHGLTTLSTRPALFAVDDIGFVLAPEPGTALLFGVGLAALARRRLGRARAARAA